MVFIFCITTTSLVLSIIGLFSLDDDWDLTEMWTDNTHLREFAEDFYREDIAGEKFDLVMTIDSIVDDKEHLDNMLEELGNSEEVYNLVGWYKTYRDYYLPLTGNDFPSTDEDLADDVYVFITTDDYGMNYYDDITYTDDSRTKILTSRMFYGLTCSQNYHLMLDYMDIVKDVMKSYDKEGFTSFGYNKLGAVYESNIAIIEETFFAVMLCVPIILVIIAFVTRHVKATFFVFIMVASTDIQIIGIAYWLGVNFDFFLVYVYWWR
eukprot:UN31460